MGCKSSKVRVVQPSERRKSGWGADTKDDLQSPKNPSSARDGSALSKGTMDSGLGHDEAVESHLPGRVAETVFSPRSNNDILNRETIAKERQTSSDILEELMTQGIIQSQSKVVRNGEAYDVMMETPGKSLRRPPAKLEKLKTIRKKNKSLTKEDIEAKMQAAEERRKTKEEELKKRLRDRPMTALPSIAEFRMEGSFTPDDGQEAEPNAAAETLDSDAPENGMSGPTQSPTAAEEYDETGDVESDNTYNKPTDQNSNFENDLF